MDVWALPCMCTHLPHPSRQLTLLQHNFCDREQTTSQRVVMGACVRQSTVTISAQAMPNVGHSERPMLRGTLQQHQQ